MFLFTIKRYYYFRRKIWFMIFNFPVVNSTLCQLFPKVSFIWSCIFRSSQITLFAICFKEGSVWCGSLEIDAHAQLQWIRKIRTLFPSYPRTFGDVQNGVVDVVAPPQSRRAAKRSCGNPIFSSRHIEFWIMFLDNFFWCLNENYS